MWKIIGLKIQTVRSCLGTSSTCTKNKLKKRKISIFGEISKFLRSNWFWADFENKWAYTAIWGWFQHALIVFSNFDREYLLKYEEFWSMNDLFGKVSVFERQHLQGVRRADCVGTTTSRNQTKLQCSRNETGDWEWDCKCL